MIMYCNIFKYVNRILLFVKIIEFRFLNCIFLFYGIMYFLNNIYMNKFKLLNRIRLVNC